MHKQITRKSSPLTSKYNTEINSIRIHINIARESSPLTSKRNYERNSIRMHINFGRESSPMTLKIYHKTNSISEPKHFTNYLTSLILIYNTDRAISWASERSWDANPTPLNVWWRCHLSTSALVAHDKYSLTWFVYYLIDSSDSLF